MQVSEAEQAMEDQEALMVEDQEALMAHVSGLHGEGISDHSHV